MSQTIFNYPLRKAQEEGYFKPINFRPVMEFRLNFADRTIALSAIAQLQRDLDDGFDHIVMARASDIVRAEMVHAIYRELADSFNPLLIHSRLGEEERRTALRSLCDRSTRIIVCVDMLGEGFDLPELKIAALHDMHKSLAVTLQFIGRFTRTKENIGEASVIANIADARVEESLQELYAEDADWNFLLRGLSEGATGRQERRSEFLENFTDVPAEIPLQNVLPKMSTVVFRTNCVNWRPENVHMAVEDDRLYAGPSVNHESRVLLFVTRELEPIPWGIVKGIENTTWDLYLVHWWPEKQLLFINSSNNASLHEDLAKAIVGDDIELFRGERVFRALHGVNRLILMNLGLNHSLSRAVRFTMYVGADIHEGLSEAHLQNKIKSNIFGRGYEGGGKATIGCSYKGRVWSYRVAGDISEWVDWCHRVGDKLLDEMISVEEILRHVMKPRQIGERPALAPLTIEWSEAFLQRSEEMIRVDVDGDVVPFYEAGLEMNRPDRKGPLRFRVFTESKSAEYEVKFTKSGVEYVPTEGAGVEFLLSRKRRSLTEWFQIEPPVIRFEDGSFLIYNEFFELPRGDREPFDRERIVAWDWAGTNLKVESQTIHRHADSIQYRVIQTLLSPSHDPHYDLVFDDDDAHEAADIVAMKVAGERLLVHFFHCKYSKEPGPGARVDDLYAVCGQAQRSVFWKGDVGNLFEHLRLRDASRLKRHSVSRFDLGDMAKLMEISRRARYLIPDFKIFVVQPGLSKQQADTNQLELLAVTELYLKETYAIAFEVIASA